VQIDGAVYKASMRVGRVCAIKVMNPGPGRPPPQIVDRFWAEAGPVANTVVTRYIVTFSMFGVDRGYH